MIQVQEPVLMPCMCRETARHHSALSMSDVIAAYRVELLIFCISQNLSFIEVVPYHTVSVLEYM